MAENKDKSTAGTEKAYTDAVDKAVTANVKIVGKAVEANSSDPVKVDAVAKAVAAPAGLNSGQTRTKAADAPKAISKKKVSSRKKAAKRRVVPEARPFKEPESPVTEEQQTTTAAAGTEEEGIRDE